MQNDYSDPRWQRLRLKCMDRDHWKCVACGDAQSTLHVHHKRYCGNIWDSPAEDLQTLCNGCHMGLGQHPKAGVWYEKVCDIDRQFLVADNWHKRPETVEKDAVAVAIQNCPQCGQHQFEAGDKVVACLSCGWSMQCVTYMFLHTPAMLIDPASAKATREAEDLARKKASALGTMKTWVRKCRGYGFSDEEIWSAVFPEHAVPLGYQFDAGGLLTVSEISEEDVQKLRAYLTSGMTFSDVVWEVAGVSEKSRKALAKSGY